MEFNNIRKHVSAGLLLFLGMGLAPVAESAEKAWITDPSSTELQRLAQPLTPGRSKYGCGPLLRPGKTYHLSSRGADPSDGLSWGTAWRHFGVAVSRLRAGDTLIVEEGTYVEPKTLTIAAPVSGEPGRPISIVAAPGHRVILSGSELLELRKAEGLRNCYEATVDMELLSSAVRETDTLVQLEAAGDTRRVEELPATYTYDPETKRLVVHFSDSRGPDVHGLALRRGKTIGSSHSLIEDRGVEIHSSYLRFDGIWFMFNRTAMVISGKPKNPERRLQLKTIYAGGEHITVENCAFAATDFAGLVLTGSAAWNHVRNNYGAYNGSRAAISFLHPGENVHDNLIEKNWLEKAANKRRKGSAYAYGFNMYSKMGAWNLVLDNVMDDPRSLRCKPQPPATVIQGNILTGTGSFFGVWRDPSAKGPFIFRSNAVLSHINYDKVQAAENRVGAREAYVNNFQPPDRYARAKAVADAHFADVAYRDCRLQSDSPLRGKALGGGDVGAFRYPRGRVLFVGSKGDDGAAGTAVAQAWQTLAHAAAQLRADDTLYILPGAYAAPLKITASGTRDRPVVVRAHGKKAVTVAALETPGEWVRIEGLTVTGGVRVAGPHAELHHCLVRGYADGPGVAVAAADCTLRHCTIVENGVGVELTAQATDARIRDCLVAFNQTACMKRAAPQAGLLISNTCWFGPGAEPAMQASGPRCKVADPLLPDRDKGDCRPSWDSPAAHLGAFATAAGAFEALRRRPVIENAAVVNRRPNSAVVRWTTTELETAGYVAYRKTGSDTWSRPQVLASGTRHAVQLTDLKPGQTYEYIIVSTNHWNAEMAQSQRVRFATPMAARPPRTFHVSTAGSDDADGLTPETAWRTFNRAFPDVGAGDTILVAPGQYHETLLPIAGGVEGRPVVVRGQGDVVVDCMDVTGPYLIARNLHHVEFHNITFDRIPTYGSFMGIMIQIALRDCANIRFQNCRVNKTHRVPRSQTFVLNNCRDITLDHVVCWSGETLVVARSCDNLVIRNCTFADGTVWGMRFSGKIGRVSLVNNIIYNPAWNPNALFYIEQSKPDLSFLTSDYNCFVMDCYGDEKRLRYAGVGSFPKFTLECRTLEEWREKSGQDAHSIEISRKDPLFHNPRKGRFLLHAKSPALGAAKNGGNLGALGVFPLYASGKRNYNVGEARTVRLCAEMLGGIPPNTEFEWTVPYSEKKRRGRTSEYTPIDCRVGGTITLCRVGHEKDVVAIAVTVPTKEMSELKTFFLLETEDRVAEGGGKVMEHTDWLQSGRAAISHWNTAGHWMEWEFDVPADGAYEFHLKFARARDGVASRTFLIDGKCPAPEFAKLTFRNVWTWGCPWHYQKLGSRITLTKGKHRLRMDNHDGTSLNTDCFVIVPEVRK